MSDSSTVYKGSVVVLNNTATGDTDQNTSAIFTVTHYVDNAIDCPIYQQNIEPNTCSRYGQSNFQTGYDDHWMIELSIPNGPTYSSGKFKGDFTHEDKDATLIINIVPSSSNTYKALLIFPVSQNISVTLS